jgi:hypothetical protein
LKYLAHTPLCEIVETCRYYYLKFAFATLLQTVKKDNSVNFSVAIGIAQFYGAALSYIHTL